MHPIPRIALCCALAFTPAFTVAAQAPQISADSATVLPNYATTVSRVLQSPLVIDATIASATRIKGAEAAGLAPGHVRFYVEADVGALIRGPGALPATIGYVVDAPLDWRGHPPKLKKRRVLLLARPVPGRPDQVQLTTRDGQHDWTPDLDALVRRVVEQVVARNAPPPITGVGNAFHVPGTLPGEGETQIFLATESGAPVSLQILRRPGEQPHWGVSTGDIVDSSAGPPQPETLLWYRLACGLPAALPDSSVENETPDNAAVAREDYQMVRQALGPCEVAPAS